MEFENKLNKMTNDFISDDDPSFMNFVKVHKAQLDSNKIPKIFWKSLFIKLKCEIFDAGSIFSMFQIQYEEVELNYLPLYKVVVSCDDPIDPENKDHIFLIDHAWTYKAPEAKVHLRELPGLLNRMANLMGKSVDSVTVLDDVINTMWKFNLTYTYSFGVNIEDRLPLWYIMDEFGSAIQHSDVPNVKIVPFIYLPEGVTYSLLYPLNKICKDEEVTRDFADGYTDTNVRKAALLPWIPNDLKHITYVQEEPSEEYFLSGRLLESLPNLSLLRPKESNGNFITPSGSWKVYSDYSFINKYLTHSKFQCVQDQNDADILWLTTPFKEYLEFSEKYPHKFINQFPFENVITIKDLLSIVCRRIVENKENYNLSTLDTYPSWLPTTFNLNTELPKFVSFFQNRESKGLDNHWICKPWNLARSLDIHITNNLDYLIRVASSRSKIAQKYIFRPVLFYRPECGLVKFDIRYVILLKSVSPLEVYVYRNFFLRFANKPFSLQDFEDYEKHFTVMNYNNDAPLCKMLCSDFIKAFNVQNTSTNWEAVEMDIFSMFLKVFEAATMKQPPCGIGDSPQSRALYAADIMLSIDDTGKYEPKLLEINWTPDCQRACEYYPDFYNDIFSLLFLDEAKDVFSRLV